MDVDLTLERQGRLAEAGYVPAPALGTVPVRGRIRVQDAGGNPFDLELVALADGAREASVAHLAGWFSVADPAVEPLVDALDLDDAIGYLTAVAAPCTLETFVEVSGRLGAGHTSTLLVTIGRALARLHARGLRYGPMRPQDVLIDDGRVVLTVPKPAPAGAAPLAPSPQEDAYHLAALADAVIAPAHGPQAGDRPEPGLRGLVKLIVSALGDAESRPGVGTLATLSHDLAPCLPLVLPRAAVPDAEEMGEPPVPGEPRASGELRASGEPRADGLPRDRASSRFRTLSPADAVRRGSLDRPPPRRKAFRGSTSRLPAAGAAAPGPPDPLGGAAPSTPEREVGPSTPDPVLRRSTSDPQPRRLRRPVVLVGLVLAGLLGGGVIVHRVGADAPAHAAPGELASAPAPEPAQEDPGAAAAQLTAARMDAVVALTNAPLDAEDSQVSGGASGVPSDGWGGVLVPGSPAHLQASELVASLRAEGARISGLTVETAGVEVLAQTAGSPSAPATAQVQVTFTIGAYTVESAEGARTVAASAPRTAVLDLVATDSGWRVATVAETAPPG